FSLQIIQNLKKIYRDIDNVDVWVGGLLETTSNGPGELFHHIILEQFLRIRDGDRFWFENNNNGHFSSENVSRIRNTFLKNVIVAVTDIKETDIQDDVFHYNEEDPCYEVGKTLNLLIINSSSMEKCTNMHTFDYFEGSEKPYMFSFGAMLTWIFACALMLFILSKATNWWNIKKQKQIAFQQSVECISNIRIYAQGQKTNIIFHVDIRTMSTIIIIFISFFLNMVFLCMNLFSFYIHYSYIFKVLLFPNRILRQKFVQDLERFLGGLKIMVKTKELTQDNMLFASITKQQRQQTLERFFRTAFAQALTQNVNPVDRITRWNTEIAQEVLSCRLTKHEFAEALSMQQNSLFVEQMFDVVDKEHFGTISFRDLLDMLVIFAKGTPEEKLRLMFDVYDIGHTGTLSRDEFKAMVKSMVEGMSGTVEQDNVEELINSMFERAGFKEKEKLNFKDFLKLMEEHKKHFDRVYIGVTGICSNGNVQMVKEQIFNISTFNVRGLNNEIKRNQLAQDIINYNVDVACLQETKTEKPINEDICGDASLTWELRSGITGMASSFTRDGLKAFINIGKYLKGFRFCKLKQEKGREIERNNDSKLKCGRKDFRYVKTVKAKYYRTSVERSLLSTTRFIENNRLRMFNLALYCLVVLGIFAERAYYYSIEREHTGLRTIAGYGVSITRGAASVMLFTYSLLLLTMCRNLITKLRQTFVNRFIPFDSAVCFHKIVAFSALFFTIIHCVGHALNFYHIATQPADDLSCLFRDFFHRSHELPKFQYWLYYTITGSTGVLLVVITSIIYIFASQYARQNSFNLFWITHNFYILLYILMMLHGSGRLVQRPFFHLFFVGPAIVFVIDKLISVSRKKVTIYVKRADLLPSNVTYLEFQRPSHFEYKSGQWVRISCPRIGNSEFHPFTLTSAPHEDTLTVHIRAVGPWTTKLYHLFDPNNLKGSQYPKLCLDGPFGEGHQDWYQFDIAVLIGGGIGVTPYASIMKDIINKTNNNSRISCKKVRVYKYINNNKWSNWGI
ncbi:dual oxidase 1-like, partial [Anneissia japonica]|uniref:dual oxidase 1-like n=1 Tax=Anneissia japonica TaxID=1529436 RepID=UPI001425AFA0